jgi:hypothetical protein
VLRDALEELFRGLDHDAAIPRQVASPEDRERVLGERRQHVRTVRSAAWSRNRPRRRLAWLLLLVLLALIALAVRVNAAPRPDPIEIARCYADAITGADVAPERASTRSRCDDDDDGDDNDGDDGDGDGDDDESDDNDGDETIAGIGDPPDGLPPDGLAHLAGVADDGLDPPDAPVADDGVDPPDGLPPGGLARLAAVADDGLDPPDALSVDDGLDPDALPADGGPGALAMLDAELDPGDAMAGADAGAASATAGAAEIYEQWMRHRRPSAWGRLDVGMSWRTRWSEPMHAPANRYSELWLVATWRR